MNDYSKMLIRAWEDAFFMKNRSLAHLDMGTIVKHELCQACQNTQAIPAGATCSRCGKDYPYADPIKGFMCWGCRNGY